jgi:hypothetical protein
MIMPINSINSTFLLYLPAEKINQTLVSFLEQGVEFELLNPMNLPSDNTNQWDSVLFYEEKLDVDLDQKMLMLDKVLQKYASKLDFINQKSSGSIVKKLENWKEIYLLDIIHKLSKNSPVYHKDLIKRGVIKNDKLTILEDLKALYTKYEIQKKANQAQAQFFRLNPTTDALFGFVSVPEYLEPMANGILTFLQVDYDTIKWETAVLDWKSRELFSPYQKLIKESKPDFRFNFGFVDPARFLALFATFCVGFIFSDILAGLVIIAVSVLLFVLRKTYPLKKQFVYLQFYAGLVSILFGLVLGRFGGNLLAQSWLKNTPFEVLQKILNSFQLLDLYEVKQSFLPINTLINQNKIELDWLVVGGFLGLSLTVFAINFWVLSSNKMKENQPKEALLSIICLSNLVMLGLVTTGFLPILSIVFSLGVLLVFQTNSNFQIKLKSFFTGNFGIVGIGNLILKLACMCSFFGLSLFYGGMCSLINQSFGGMVLNILVAHIVLVFFVWQTALALANRIFINEFLEFFDIGNAKIFRPIGKFKWWKL